MFETSAIGLDESALVQPSPCKTITSPGLILSAAGIPASHSALLDDNSESLTRDTSGLSLRESLASYDPDTRSWRTSQITLLSDLEQFSETWPNSGMMRSGTCYAQSPLVLHIDVRASFSLPTIGANEYRGTSRKRFVGSPHFRGAKMAEGLRFSEHDLTYLNPSFGEMAMGFDLGWTALGPSETPSSLKSQNLLGDE